MTIIIVDLRPKTRSIYSSRKNSPSDQTNTSTKRRREQQQTMSHHDQSLTKEGKTATPKNDFYDFELGLGQQKTNIPVEDVQQQQPIFANTSSANSADASTSNQ